MKMCHTHSYDSIIFQMTDTALEGHRLLKEEGNQYFKQGHYERALSCYTEALNLSSKVGSGCNDSELVVYYKNRAATHLKLKNYDSAIQDSSKGER